jgi:hypothetical protein
VPEVIALPTCKRPNVMVTYVRESAPVWNGSREVLEERNLYCILEIWWRRVKQFKVDENVM